MPFAQEGSADDLSAPTHGQEEESTNQNATAAPHDASLHGLELGMSRLTHTGGANFTDYVQAQKQLQHHRHNHHNNNHHPLPVEIYQEEEDQGAAAQKSAGVVEWERVFDELAAIDEDGHFHDDQDHATRWYLPPVQRQRWGQDQMLPHINWGDLFFDLFYVAAAYNLGALMISALTNQQWPRGLVYFVGIFGPLYNTWETATYIESRYTTVDYAHRLFEVIRFLFVSVAVLHIKPLDLLADPKSMEALLFVSAIFLESMMHLGLNLELYVKGQGDRAAIQNHSLTKIKFQLLPTLAVYAAATIVAAVQFAQPSNDENEDKDQTTTTVLPWNVADLPLTLTALAYLLNIGHTTWRKMRATSGKHGDIRTRFVPNNIGFMIHRYGEWIMLMIGESILSLLIVETTESQHYYLISTFGVLTVILLQILKFESEPSHAEDHALWGNLRNSMSYGYLIQILSMGLIAFGISFKVFLKDIVKEEKKYGDNNQDSDYGDDEQGHRVLAPSSLGATNEAAAAALFTGSLSIVLISLELMLLTHNGVKKAIGRLFHDTPTAPNDSHDSPPRRRGDLNIPIVIIAVVKLGVILFTLTLNQWTKDPVALTLCGFGIVLTMALTRVLGWAFVHHRKTIHQVAKKVTRNFAKTVSVGGPSIRSSSSEKALEAQQFFNGAGDVGEESDSHSVTTKGTDVFSKGIDDSFDAIVVADLKGSIKQVNTTTLEVFGYETKKELVGKNLTILVGGGEGKNHDAYVRGFRTKGGSKASKVLGRQRVLQAKKADGTEFPCIIGIKMCANDTRIVGYIRDMSGVVDQEKMKMTKDMQVEEAIDRVVDDHAFDAVLVSDLHGIIHRVNNTAVTEFGYSSKDEMIGLNISTIIHAAKDHPERLLENHGEQHLVTLTSKVGVDFDSIIATTKIKGADDMIASYIRNINPIKSRLSEEQTL